MSKPLVTFIGLALLVVVNACGSPPTVPSPTSLSVTRMIPDTGSTFGSVSSVVGTGFADGDVVRIDGAVATAVVLNPTVIHVTMPAHTSGPVDVTVTDPSGATAGLPQGFSYVGVDPPVVTRITPAAGFLDGGNMVTVVGTGFQPTATVTIGDLTAVIEDYNPNAVRTSTALSVRAPAHGAGPVDVVVTNADGQKHRIPGGYTYAPSETFDFNGVWKGFGWEIGTPITLTIQNNVLVSVTCGSVSNHTFSPAPVVSRGQFSVKGADGSMTGQIWSPIEAQGSIDVPGCPAAWGWFVSR
jgi:hypothetical protein